MKIYAHKKKMWKKTDVPTSLSVLPVSLGKKIMNAVGGRSLDTYRKGAATLFRLARKWWFWLVGMWLLV